jgi:hypothetical protein
MTNGITATINVNQLGDGLPAITPAFGETLVEAISVCFTDQNHASSCIFSVDGDFQTQVRFVYPLVTSQMQRCWNDAEATTEQAAYGIAFLLVHHLTDLTVIERSRRGTGFDYWLGLEQQPNLPFQRMMRLEVSGIRKGNSRLLNARVRIKTEQVQRFKNSLPAYVVVVEFGTPCAKIVEV